MEIWVFLVLADHVGFSYLGLLVIHFLRDSRPSYGTLCKMLWTVASFV